MRPLPLAILLMFLCCPGCGPLPYKGTKGKPGLPPASSADWPFKPVSMRVHPFTAMSFDEAAGKWVVEARVELVDVLGDVTKGLGAFRFELYAVAPTEGRAGEETRLYVWEDSVATLDQTRARYDPITRTYYFKLQLDEPPLPKQRLRLAVQFNAAWGERLNATGQVEPAKPE